MRYNNDIISDWNSIIFPHEKKTHSEELNASKKHKTKQIPKKKIHFKRKRFFDVKKQNDSFVAPMWCLILLLITWFSVLHT